MLIPLPWIFPPNIHGRGINPGYIGGSKGRRIVENRRIELIRWTVEAMWAASQDVSPEHQDRHQRTIAFAQDRLDFLLEDLATREESPLFQRARQLFEAGYRLSGWGIDNELVDDTELTLDGKELAFWAMFSSEEEDRDDGRFYQALGIQVEFSSDNERSRVLWHLANLTEEEG
jgi:hypothetical protein